MRVVARRDKVRIGDRLVADIVTPGPDQGTEGVSAPIAVLGDESVVLSDGTIVPLPSGVAVYLERGFPPGSFLGDLEGDDDDDSPLTI